MDYVNGTVRLRLHYTVFIRKRHGNVLVCPAVYIEPFSYLASNEEASAQQGCADWGAWGVSRSPISSNLRESRPKGSHAGRDLATVFSGVFSFLVTIAGQLVKTPPPPTEGVSAHHW